MRHRLPSSLRARFAQSSDQFPTEGSLIGCPSMVRLQQSELQPQPLVGPKLPMDSLEESGAKLTP
jgi:hypothetical protein